jgi:hypothetical protein
MRYIANSRIADGVTPDQLAAFFDENSFSSAAWDLVQRRVITEYALKVGDVPGVVLFLEAPSLTDASATVNELPAVQRGFLTFDLDPLGKVMRV